MNGDTLSPGYISDNRLAANRIAALRPVDHQVVDPLDFDDPIPRTLAIGLDRPLCLSLRRRRKLLGSQLLEDLASAETAEAERRVEVVHFAVAVLAGNALQLIFRSLGKVEAHAPGFPIQILLPNLDGLVPLFGIYQMADLVARFGRLYER